MTRTTAFYRAEARAEASMCNWLIAGQLYRKAIEVYPNKHSALAKLDIDALTRKAKACEIMLQQEAEDQ